MDVLYILGSSSGTCPMLSPLQELRERERASETESTVKESRVVGLGGTCRGGLDGIHSGAI